MKSDLIKMQFFSMLLYFHRKNEIDNFSFRGLEFSSYEIEFRKEVTQKEVEVEKSNILIRVTNSKIKFLFLYFRVTNSKLNNKKLHFELLTRSRKIKSYTSSY